MENEEILSAVETIKSLAQRFGMSANSTLTEIATGVDESFHKLEQSRDAYAAKLHDFDAWAQLSDEKRSQLIKERSYQVQDEAFTTANPPTRSVG